MNLDGVCPHTYDTILWTVLHASTPSISPGPEEATGRCDRPVGSDPAKRKRKKKKKKGKKDQITRKQKKEKSYHPTASSLILSQAHHPHDLLQLSFASWLSLGKDVSFKHSYM